MSPIGLSFLWRPRRSRSAYPPNIRIGDPQRVHQLTTLAGAVRSSSAREQGSEQVCAPTVRSTMHRPMPTADRHRRSSEVLVMLPTVRDSLIGRKRRHSRQQTKARQRKPLLERLEDRTVPTVLDLTGSEMAFGSVNGALFTNLNDTNFNTSTGTGVIQPFLRVQNNGIEQGFNTTASNPQIVNPSATVDN